MRLNGFNLLHNIDKTDSVHLVGALLIFLTILSVMNFYALMFSLDRTLITYSYMYVEYAFLESTVFVFVDLKIKITRACPYCLSSVLYASCPSEL